MVTLKEIFRKNVETKKASESYPFLDSEEAYKLWKKERDEEPLLINRIEVGYIIRKEVSKLPPAFCSCGGRLVVETICFSCSEFRNGYRTKVKCLKCKQSELSRKEFLECLMELYSFLKP